MIRTTLCFIFFFFNDTATTEIYTLSLHDALPIFGWWRPGEDLGCLRFLVQSLHVLQRLDRVSGVDRDVSDRKSTRLNSSHSQISYAVFCLKKKKIDSESLPVSHHRTRVTDIFAV